MNHQQRTIMDLVIELGDMGSITHIEESVLRNNGYESISHRVMQRDYGDFRVIYRRNLETHDYHLECFRRI